MILTDLNMISGTGQVNPDQSKKGYQTDDIHQPKNTGPKMKVTRYVEFILTLVRIRLALATCLLWDIFGGFFSFSDYDKEHPAIVTGQQRMVTPPWHLIIVEVRVCSALDLYFSYWNTALYHRIS